MVEWWVHMPSGRSRPKSASNDVASLAAIQECLLASQRRHEQAATPIQWKFTRAGLAQTHQAPCRQL
jgi:hypothetical protein